MSEGHLVKAAFELAEALNKVADDHLTEKLAGIVKLHAGIAVASAFVPIPGADMAAAGANIWTMYVRINKETGLPFGENVIKSVAAGVVTNIGGAVAGLLVAGSALKFLPGLGTLGGAAIMAGTVYGVTIVSGIVYMKAIAKLLRSRGAGGVSESDIDAAVREEMSRTDLKNMVKSEGKDYKKK